MNKSRSINIYNINREKRENLEGMEASFEVASLTFTKFIGFLVIVIMRIYKCLCITSIVVLLTVVAVVVLLVRLLFCYQLHPLTKSPNLLSSLSLALCNATQPTTRKRKANETNNEGRETRLYEMIVGSISVSLEFDFGLDFIPPKSKITGFDPSG